MKVLWFEVTEPSAYSSEGSPIGGWQDSLERIVRTVPEIELMIAFVSDKYSEVKVVNGVTYIPIYAHWSLFEWKFCKYWDTYIKKVLPQAKCIVEKYKPNLIHIFGTEWPFGQIATYTNIPVVIHVMGSIVPYNNANYPPGYSFSSSVLHCWWNPKKVWESFIDKRNLKNRELWERSTWKVVDNYMGRTQWDCALSRIMHPERRYFHVEEALRKEFVSGNHQWKRPKDNKLRLFSTGCSTFWKGPDMMLKVAKILTDLGVDFEWQIAGSMTDSIKKYVEKREKTRFEDNHICILGYKQPAEFIEILCSSTMYVHTAYIENSPNSICEAQCLGVPVVSTNVGGIASLVRNGIDGILVPANDPWQMADAIVQLAGDGDKMESFSENSRVFALQRHDDEHIKAQLLECYHMVSGLRLAE